MAQDGVIQAKMQQEMRDKEILGLFQINQQKILAAKLSDKQQQSIPGVNASAPAQMEKLPKTGVQDIMGLLYNQPVSGPQEPPVDEQIPSGN